MSDTRKVISAEANRLLIVEFDPGWDELNSPIWLTLECVYRREGQWESKRIRLNDIELGKLLVAAGITRSTEETQP